MPDSFLHSQDYLRAPAILKKFIQNKIAIEGCSEKTASEYFLDLRTFFRYLEATRRNLPTWGPEFAEIDLTPVDLAYVLKIDRETVVDFLSYAATDRQNEKPSRARKLSALKSFFRFISSLDNRYEDFDPTKNIRSPKKEQHLPKYLTEEESIALLQAVLDDTDSRSMTRDFTIITLFLNCGMRLSELVMLNLTDLDPALRSLRVFGKGAKERIIYLNEACASALARYLELRAGLRPVKAHENALFLSNRSQRISQKTVQAMVYKYLDAAGLSMRGLSVHKLRHTAATLMYQSGKVDVRVLKDILGHAQLNTTQIYTHLSDRNMERAMASNPLASLTLTPHERHPAPDTDEED